MNLDRRWSRAGSSAPVSAVLGTLPSLLLVLGWTAVAAAQTVPPDGANFRANTYTTNTQQDPSVAVVDQEGNFIVVWHGDGSGDMEGVFAQRYNADGSADGGEFLVNTTTTNDQQFADVASDFDGNFVVVWQGRRDAYGGNPAIFGQRFDSDGAVGGEFVILTDIDYYQYVAERPEVSMDLSGEFVVTWMNTIDAVGSDRLMLAQLFDPDGTPAGGEFLVSDQELGPAAQPSPAKNVVSGDFVVVWDAYGGCTPEGGEICAQRFDLGGTPVGDAFQVEGDTAGNPRYSEVASSFDGDFIVVWEQSGEIMGKRYDEDGNIVNSDFQVNTYTTASQGSPAVTAGDLDGNFTVAWESFETTPGAEIRARWLSDDFQEDGVTEVDDFVVNSYTDQFQNEVAVAADFDGNFIVVWDGPGSGDPSGVFGQRYLEPVELEINDFNVDEGDPAALRTTAVFSVQASKVHPIPGVDVTVDYFTEDNTATFLEDYEMTSGSLLFDDATPLVQPIEVPIIGDTIYEGDETFLMNLTNVENAVVTINQGVGTIVNDDPPGVLKINNVSMTEGDSGQQSFVFTVTIDPSQQLDASVNFATVDETATADEDYEQTSGVLSIPAGFIEGFLTVQVFGDTAFEDDETFLVELSEPVNATVGASTPGFEGRGTILTDETCPLPPTIDPDMAVFDVPGGTGVIDVMDPANCGWSAVSNDPWITILSAPNGTGDGQVDYEVAVNDEIEQRLGTMTVAEQTFTVQQSGTLCNFTLDPPSAGFLAAGGVGQVSVDATDPICDWTAESLDPWIQILGSPDCPADPAGKGECQHGGTGDGVVEYSVDVNEGLDRKGSMIIAVSIFDVSQSGIFFDDFDDGVLDPEWIYTGDFWSEAGSRLRADPTEAGELAQAVARPAFIGCVECTVSADLRFNIFSQGVATLLGWYLNDDNLVSLTANEFANTWTLTQRVGGVDVATVSTNLFDIVVGQDYAAEVDFDGVNFTVFVDGVLATGLPAAATPDGTVGFRVAETDADFDEIMALTATTGNLPATVVITAPPDGSMSVEGIPIDFVGLAMDPEDGDISADLVWTSDLDGVFGSGGAPTAVLSVGTHAIHAEALDSGDLPAFDDITITVVPNMAPVVTITAPPDSSVFLEGVPISFAGTAMDDGDGDITAGLVWTSDIDGTIGTGGSFMVPLTPGIHAITAAVTDSGGLPGSDAISVEVLPLLIFEDGFESGDTSAWSTTVP